jgi:predicted kinase
MAGSNVKRPYALLLFGAPCSGKSAFAAEFSKQFKALYIDLSNLGLSESTIVSIISQIADSGQTIIIEGGLDTEQDRQAVAKALRKKLYKPTLVWIQTDISTIKKRLVTKLKSPAKAKSAYESAVAKLEAPSDSEFPVILSGKHTFASQRATILAHLSQ